MDINSMFCLKLPECLPRQRLGHLFHQFIPRHGFCAVVDTDHGNAAVHGANDEAEPASDAIIFPNLRLIDDDRIAVVSLFLGENVDALVSTVFTGDIAEITLDTLRFIDAGDRFVEQVQIAEIGNAFQGFTSNGVEILVSFFLHPVREAFRHVINNPETIVHDCRAYLDARSSE